MHDASEANIGGRNKINDNTNIHTIITGRIYERSSFYGILQTIFKKETSNHEKSFYVQFTFNIYKTIFLLGFKDKYKNPKIYLVINW